MSAAPTDANPRTEDPKSATLSREKKPSSSSLLNDLKLQLNVVLYRFGLLFSVCSPSEETKKSQWYKIFHEVCISTSMPETQKYLYAEGMTKKKKLFFALLCVDVVLRGVAQVFLCNHPLCGVLVLIGLGFTSIELPLFAILGTAVSTFSAVTVARPPEADILAGLCGYDGALVGCACLSFIDGLREEIAASVLLSFLAGMVHVALANLMQLWQLPAFTFAFNVVTIMLLFAMNGEHVHLRFKTSPPIPRAPDWTDISLMFVVDASIRGVGQFMFADTTIGSAFVIAGIALCSRKGASIAVLGAIVGWIVAFYVLDVTNRENVRTGIYGYNCAGTCCVLAGGIFYKVHDGAILVGVCGACLAALLHQGFAGAFGGLPVLTFPFIVSAWIMMLSRSKWLTASPEGFIRPLLRKMSTKTLLDQLPSFVLKDKNGGGSPDPIQRLRSRLRSVQSLGRLTEGENEHSGSSGATLEKKNSLSGGWAPSLSSKKYSASVKIAAEEKVHPYDSDDVESRTTPVKTIASMKGAAGSNSFKQVARALVDVQREIRQEQKQEQVEVAQTMSGVREYRDSEVEDIEDL